MTAILIIKRRGRIAGLEQGQAHWPEAAAAARARVVIRAKLQLERRTRDLALFNLAIDSKLRGCDLVALRVDDVAPNGYAVDRANVRQRKTGRPVRFELTEVTRQALDDYLRSATGKQGNACFRVAAALISI